MLSLGKAYAQQGKYKDAIKLWQNGIAFVYTADRAYNKLSYFYGNTGAVFGILGDYETAMKYAYKAVEVAQDNEQMIVAYNNISMVLQLTPNIPVSRPLYYLNLARQKSLAIHDDKLLASTLANIGTLYIRQQDWQKGRLYFDSALTLANTAHLPEVSYSTLLSLGELYLSLHKPDVALEYLLQLKEPGNTQTSPTYTSLCNLRLGEAYIQLKEYSKAKTYITQAEAASKKLGLKTYRMQVYETLSRLYAELGAYDKSLYYFKNYAALRDSVFQQRTIDRVNEMDIKYNTAQKEQQIIANRLLIANQQNRIRLKNLLLIAGGSGMLLLVIILIIVAKNARQKQKLMLRDKTISNLKAMMNGEEKERIRIARELHDGIGGMLAAVKLNFGALAKEYQSQDPDKTKLIAGMLQATAEEVRSVAHNLMPETVLQFGLQQSLETYCNQVTGPDRQPEINLQFHGNLSLLNKSMELVLYRICQELIQNVLKHAHAGKIDIQLMEYEGKINLTAEDDGMGFDTDTVQYGMGLQGIRLRLQALQGFISVVSRKNEGTSIHIEFDILNEKQTQPL